MTKQKRWVCVAVMSIAAIQMGGVGMSPMLAEMSKAFPISNESQIQFVSTLPNLTLFITAIGILALSRKIPLKYLAAIGAGISCLFALLGFAFHESLVELYVWSCVLGIASGITCNVGAYIINDVFGPEERVRVLGMQALAGALGTTIMTYLSGKLIDYGWHFGYLVYLIMLPALFLSLIVVPYETKTDEVMQDERKSETNWLVICSCTVMTFCFGMNYNVNNVNLAMLITSEGIGTSSVAGTILSASMLASGAVGLLVSRISAKIGKYILCLSIGILLVGYLLLSSTTSLPMVTVGSLLSGCTVSLMMPSAISIASSYGSEKAQLAMTLSMLGSQVGALFSPIISDISTVIFDTQAVGARYLTSTGLTFILFVTVAAFVALYFGGRGEVRSLTTSMPSQE